MKSSLMNDNLKWQKLLQKNKSSLENSQVMLENYLTSFFLIEFFPQKINKLCHKILCKITHTKKNRRLFLWEIASCVILIIFLYLKKRVSSTP